MKSLFLWLVPGVLSVGVYFYVPSSGEKCFQDDVPAKQVILVKYKYQSSSGVPCAIQFRDKKGAVLSQHSVTEGSGDAGQTAFMTQSSGETSICVKCMGSRWSDGEPIKWELKVDVGGEYLSDFDSVKKDEVKSVTDEISRVFSRVQGLHAENEYERVTEIRAKAVRERTSSEIVWMNIFGIFAIIVVSLFQVHFLRRYFKQEAF